MNTTIEVLHLPRGRIDANQQEAIVKLDPVKERIVELEELYANAIQAKEDFSEAVKVTAEASGLIAGVLRKFVVARVKDKQEERQRECEQLQFLFDEVG